MAKILIIGIHGTDHPLELGPVSDAVAAAVLTEYRTGKKRVIDLIDVTKEHITYISRRDA